MKALVIGSGIIGLSTAHVLQEHGLKVKVISKDLPQSTTSWRAAAVWFPYKAYPLEKVLEWSRISYHYYHNYLDRPDTGVSMVSLRILESIDAAKEWLEAVPSEVKEISGTSLPKGYQEAIEFQVPLVDTSYFLPYLLTTFLINGGEFEMKILRSVDDLDYSEHDWVINCAGLGSRQLVNDEKMYPIRGQIVKVKAQPNLGWIAAEHGPLALSYVIPRKNEVILGGTAEPGVEHCDIDPEETKRILERCKKLAPGLNPAIIKVEVGLRPGRDEVRLERDGDKIIHNYGHGGSGFTVCWGCAQEVAAIMGLAAEQI
ncbi:MAG: FAD-binding oxidoreductase [Saprospiraceae bacterium]|nr:FAD-binding oxidoreductase [Saprospiraceae bacterium]